MSIQSEITRISGNITAAFTAIVNKGVTVPSGSNSDDLATLIGQITGSSGSAVTVTDTTDTAGGTIRSITAVSLAGDTVSASTLHYGVTAHNAAGAAITGEYVVPTARTASDVTVSGDTVSVAAGNYSSAVSKSVAAMTLPASADNSSSGTSKATIAASESTRYINIPTGYNGTASYYTLSGVSSSYVGSGVTQRSSSDLSASGATVTAPAGYYASAAAFSFPVYDGSLT